MIHSYFGYCVNKKERTITHLTRIVTEKTHFHLIYYDMNRLINIEIQKYQYSQWCHYVTVICHSLGAYR